MVHKQGYFPVYGANNLQVLAVAFMMELSPAMGPAQIWSKIRREITV